MAPPRVQSALGDTWMDDFLFIFFGAKIKKRQESPCDFTAIGYTTPYQVTRL